MVGGRKIFWGSIFLIPVTFPLWKPLLIDFLTPPGFEYLKKKKEKAPGDRFVIQGMNFSRSRKGVVEITVSADRAFGGSLSGAEITMRDVEVVLFDQGDEKARVTSGNGSYHPEKKQVVFPDKFIFTSDRAQIKGKGLYYDLDTGDYRINDGVIFDLNPA